MNSKDGIDFAKLFTLKTTRKAGGLQILRSHGKVSRAPRNFRIDEKVWLIKYGAVYKFGPWNMGKSPTSPTLTLIPYGGAFFFNDKWKVQVSPGGMFEGINEDGTLSYNTPMVGLDARCNLSERWYLNLSYASVHPRLL